MSNLCYKSYSFRMYLDDDFEASIIQHLDGLNKSRKAEIIRAIIKDGFDAYFSSGVVGGGIQTSKKKKISQTKKTPASNVGSTKVEGGYELKKGEAALHDGDLGINNTLNATENKRANYSANDSESGSSSGNVEQVVDVLVPAVSVHAMENSNKVNERTNNKEKEVTDDSSGLIRYEAGSGATSDRAGNSVAESPEIEPDGEFIDPLAMLGRKFNKGNR